MERRPHASTASPERIGSRDSVEPPPAIVPNPVNSHTHVQQVASGIPVYPGGTVKALDRGTLSRIDRLVLREMDHGDGVRLVKVPLSRAVWATWRRYCQAVGLTMGEAVAGLIDQELRMIVDEPADADVPLFAARREEELAARESRVLARERDLGEIEERSREWAKRLGTWERELQAREGRLDVAARQVAQPTLAGRKIGRNERCPCGSGLKYKHCHGSGNQLRRPWSDIYSKTGSV